MRILNLGCGNKKTKKINEYDEVIGVDIVKLPDVDIVYDLDKAPWKPFKDNEFDRVVAPHVIEHLRDIVTTMKEIWRVTKNGSIVEIGVPHFSSPNAFGDPTHRCFFSLVSFDYFTSKSDLNYYSDARFEILEKKMVIDIPRMKLLSKIFNGLFNGPHSMYFYETFLSRILPIKEIRVKLKTVK